MKKSIIYLSLILFIFISCGNDKSSQNKKNGNEDEVIVEVDTGGEAPAHGVGEIEHVELNNPLDQEMVKRGKAVYEMKCASCHKLSGPRVVGPSWDGITTRRTPEWIMNMITNVDVMLEKDPEAQKLLEECLTRMPNQNVGVGDARDVLEFMYQNDADQGANK